jgi:L-lactate dehydrogenase complex protein LldG
LGQAGKIDGELESSGDPGASGTGLALEQQPADRIIETPGSQSQSLVERFGAELAALGVGFTRTTQSEASSCVLKLLHEQGITAIQAWEEAYLPPGMLADLQAAGISNQAKANPSIRAGLTGALAGIADTGSLVIPCGPGRPQTASLLPEIHIAILRLGDLYADLPQILKLREVQEAASISLITGPSRTADIEMTLSIGVHGPRQVQVICIQDPG